MDTDRSSARAVSPSNVFLFVLAAAFLLEFLIMFLLDLLPVRPGRLGAALLDAGLVAVILTPVLWVTVYRSLKILAIAALSKSAAVIDAAPDGILTFDERGRVTSINPSASRTFGYTAGEVTDKNIAMLFDSPDEERPESSVDMWLRSMASTGVGATYERVARRKDGSTFPLEFAPGEFHDGHARHFILVLRDISERRRAEEELRKLSQALAQAQNTVVITDPDGKIEYVNPTFERLTGYSRTEVLGRTPRILKSSAHATQFYKQLWDTIRQGKVYQAEFTNKKKSGELYSQEETISPVVNAQGTITHFVSTGHDLTERKRAEAALRLSEASNRQFQKMEAIGRLAGGVAHDFNNLLTAIMGFSQLMKAKFDPDDPARHDVEEILLAAARGASLTRQLLLFSRQQPVELQVLDLNATIASMDKILSRLVGEDIDVVSAPAANPVHVWADAGQLEQVLMNLAVNARDAMPEGGKLTIEASTVDLDATYAETHPGVKPGLYAMLAVSDSGTGITPEVKSHLFEPFFTTKEVGKGTGLGLSTVHGIVSNSGGHVDVYTQPGQGTTFKVYLPLTDQTARDAAAPSVEPGSCGGSETVLLVEDEEPLRRVIRTFLALQGYTVLEAKDGSEAIGICERRDQPIDLLVTDVVMPLMNGPDLARRAVLISPDLRVLFISGYTDRALVHQEMRDGATAFLQKPFMPEALARKIREILDQPLRTVA